MKYLRWLLFPFSLIYGLVVIIRNFCYDSGLFKSYRFTKPVISVGNLEVGGAGKSPMTEYLIRLLKDEYKVATLSRGYGRETKGFLLSQKSEVLSPESEAGSQKSEIVNSPDDFRLNTQDLRLSAQIGDEPSQFAYKFPDITVAVCEDRVEGLNRLMPDHDVFLMDDAYQHRAVEPGLSLLLFDYSKITNPHLLLPAGNYRELMSARWRAQVIIITKCPDDLEEKEMQLTAEVVKPLPYQQLFFTSIAYQSIRKINGTAADITIDEDTTVFLLTGIANPLPLYQYIEDQTPDVIHHNYPDHHPFTLKNITKLADEYAAHPSQKKLIITTEKDAQRLDESWLKSLNIPVYVIPISVKFLDDTGSAFNKIITDYVREHTTNNSIH